MSSGLVSAAVKLYRQGSRYFIFESIWACGGYLQQHDCCSLHRSILIRKKQINKPYSTQILSHTYYKAFELPQGILYPAQGYGIVSRNKC
jgi:hypothetical protein